MTAPGDGSRRRSPGSARHAAVDAERAPAPGSLDRVVVVGTTGSGKTDLAREAARALGVPHVEFDAYRHGPGWSETPDDVFRERLRDALAGGSWVGDGNYRVARSVVWPRATLLVWLDYPCGSCCGASAGGSCGARSVAPSSGMAIASAHGSSSSPGTRSSSGRSGATAATGGRSPASWSGRSTRT